MDRTGLRQTGYVSIEELDIKGVYPKLLEFMRGPIAVMECIEEIPCNPCEGSCKNGAIHIGEPITNLPRLDIQKCVGCGLCVAACPGLAIYIKDYTYGKAEALITFPYEYLPLPKTGQIVTAVGRRGQEICSGKIIGIHEKTVNNRTALISMAYPKEHFHGVVSMKRIAPS